MLKSCQKLISHPSRQGLHDHFVGSLRELLEAIHDIQKVLSKEIDVPYTEGGVSDDEVDLFPSESPSPSKQTSASERMLKKSIERHREEPRYIGGLGTAATKGEGKRSRPPSMAESHSVQVCVCVGVGGGVRVWVLLLEREFCWSSESHC